MKTKKTIVATLSMLALALSANSVHAEMTQAEVDRLGKDLTPTGAEKAGNKEGTIPEWQGGLTKPPAGWKPEEGYADPFAGEKPLFVITAQNAEQYKDKLSAGMLAMLKKYPTFSMPVYPSHRTFAIPQSVYDSTKAQAGKVKSEGTSIKNFTLPGTPFPQPQNGVEAMYNHLLRYFGAYNRCSDWLPVKANGDYYRVGFCEDLVQGQNFTPAQKKAFLFFGLYDAPATLVGTIYLVHDPLDYTVEKREAWIYNAGQRRVRRAPDLAYDNIDDGTEGMATTDDYWGFHGAMDRYDFKLLGKKEIYVPYNAYKLSSPKLKYKDMVEKGHLKSDLMRYELHRVRVVEATLKPGASHVVAKRVFYIDEDSNLITLADGYDGRGNLWRAYSYPLMQAYDAPLMFQAAYIGHDLNNGTYIVRGLTNERKQPATVWNSKAKMDDFTVDAIRRRGTR